MARLGFKRGSTAYKAREKVVRALKRRGVSKSRAFAIATATTKRMSKGKRSKLAKRRR